MKKLTKYTVTISDGTGIISGENEFKVEKFSVVGENDTFLVIDDARFTSMKKRSDKYSSFETILNKPHIGFSVNDKVWGNRISYTLYTDKTKRASSIKSEIERRVEKEYGFFLRGLDLSFVTEKNLDVI